MRFADKVPNTTNGDFTEEAADLPPRTLTAIKLVPHLQRCGYPDPLLAQPYDFGTGVVPLAAFADTVRDSRSACIAVIEGTNQAEADITATRPLGAPVVFACQNDSLQWWKQTTGAPQLQETIPASHLNRFFSDNKQRFAPKSVFEGKTLRRLPHQTQLTFVDAGLLPFVERDDGQQLSTLVEAGLRDIQESLERKLVRAADINNAVKATFWLLAAKALQDKGVDGFKSIVLTDVKDVFAKVGRHYGVEGALPPRGKNWTAATRSVAKRFSDFRSLGNLSTESLAHVYENALVTKEVRKAHGTHSTPSALVDYIVWQLWPWIEELPPERRTVFEPACGHGAFLLGALRVLRQWSDIEDGQKRHAYLKRHLHGVEYDSFALEVARLSLTLADIPHGNKWNLVQADMFVGDLLQQGAQRCGVLLANPPYEPFTSGERKGYARANVVLSASTKAIELLSRTIPYLANGACFGLVVPQGFLRSERVAERDIRREFVENCELHEINIFEDKLFEKAEHEVAVILGRRITSPQRRVIPFRRVRNKDRDSFRNRFAFSSEEHASVKRFAGTEQIEFWIPELDSVWQYLADAPRLSTIADVGQGFSFARSGLVTKARRSAKSRLSDSVPAIIEGHRRLNIWEHPPTTWVSPSRTPVNPWRSGHYTGKPQILVNYVRAMRGPWRIKAIYDPRGHAVINSYTTVRTRSDGPIVLFVWALLNSPLANAFVYSDTMKRHIYDSLVASIPLPPRWEHSVSEVVQATLGYMSTVRAPDHFVLQGEDDSAVRDALLRMDAAVLRAYDLPPRLERRLLDLFYGTRRKGVGCSFDAYYPPGFVSHLPLRLVLSERFERAAADRTAERFRPGESEHVRQALSIAATAFDED